MSHTRLHNIWLTMRQRCSKPNCSTYHKYGARGIRVCEEWEHSFEAFRDWSLDNGYADNLTIDRIDVNGYYSPENCRWVTQKEQQNNRSNNIILTYKGVSRPIAEWSEIKSIPLRVLYDRHYRKWDVDRILEQPTRKSPATRSHARGGGEVGTVV